MARWYSRIPGEWWPEVLSAARPSAATWMEVFSPAFYCTLVHAGVRSIHGSQMREFRVRAGAYRGARLRDGAREPAESP